MSVHRFPTFVYRRRKTSTFDQRPEVFDRNSAVDLHQGALDQLFELERSDRPIARQGKQQPPRIRRKTAPLMWSEYPKGH